MSPSRADKRKLAFSASAQLPKKRKLQSYLDPRNIRDKLGAWKELKRLQESENRPGLPTIFSNEGPPVIIQAQSPSKGNVLTPCNWETLSKSAPIGTEAEALKATIVTLQSQIESLTQRVVAAESYRKLLHCHILDLKGPIRVICRVSPSLSQASLPIDYPEAGFGASPLHTLLLNMGFARLSFTCDQVLPPGTDQRHVFAEVQSYVQAALDGQQVTILAYGATGSGKSYAIEGKEGGAEAGLLPRAAHYLFEGVQQQRLSANLRILASCLYLSDDYLHDLLSSHSPRLSIKSLGGKVVVDLLSWHEATSPEQLISLWQAAKQHRRNENASHCVFQVVLEGSDASGKIIEGQLNFVDLAGADEAKGQDGKWLEATFTALKKVINGRLRPNKVPCLPPYRDSKLTRILQDSLSTGKILFLVTVSGDLSKAAEARQTLAYASDLQTL